MACFFGPDLDQDRTGLFQMRRPAASREPTAIRIHNYNNALPLRPLRIRAAATLKPACPLVDMISVSPYYESYESYLFPTPDTRLVPPLTISVRYISRR